MHSRESGGGASQGTGPGIRTRQPTGLLTPTEWGEGGGQDAGRNFRSKEKLSRNESAKMDAGEGGKRRGGRRLVLTWQGSKSILFSFLPPLLIASQEFLQNTCKRNGEGETGLSLSPFFFPSFDHLVDDKIHGSFSPSEKEGRKEWGHFWVTTMMGEELKKGERDAPRTGVCQ